ncbi:hypothetical protein AVEN_115861-2 [Araneus ventricosus]|uniref:Uncharacterized protein n=1 Tax=Araneus ventricosus TaxID=182803 RepID=A0A4Y2K6Y9_ARAVE|nr:hypothetical protein AVEN_115861-2 [Araneus ventricosus]
MLVDLCLVTWKKTQVGGKVAGCVFRKMFKKEMVNHVKWSEGRKLMDVSRLSGICEHPEDIVKECFKECKEECVKVKFSYEVKESYRSRYARHVERNESRTIIVKIEFPEADMQKIIHKPQFQVLEIFSLIGGLLAFWIGLSMFQVVEVFDCMFQIVKCLVKKRSAGSESSAA